MSNNAVDKEVREAELEALEGKLSDAIEEYIAAEGEVISLLRGISYYYEGETCTCEDPITINVLQSDTDTDTVNRVLYCENCGRRARIEVINDE